MREASASRQGRKEGPKSERSREESCGWGKIDCLLLHQWSTVHRSSANQQSQTANRGLQIPPNNGGIPACHSSSSEAGRLKIAATRRKRSWAIFEDRSDPACPPSADQRDAQNSHDSHETFVGNFGGSPKTILLHPVNAYIVTELDFA